MYLARGVGFYLVAPSHLQFLAAIKQVEWQFELYAITVSGAGELLLDALEAVGYKDWDGNEAQFILYRVGNLKRVSAPKLAVVTGAFDIKYNRELPELILPALAHMGQGIAISNNYGLARVELPALAHVQYGIEITNNYGLESVSLGSEGKPFVLGSDGNAVLITRNAKLKNITLSMTNAADHTYSFNIHNNPELVSIVINDASVPGGA